MKRIIITLFLILSIIICLPACEDNKNNTVVENPKFESYNAMLNQEFSNYTIEITTTSANKHVVSEKYTVTTKNGSRSVAYRIEELNSLAVTENGIVVPNSYKTVTEGVYDSVSSASKKYDLPSFNFSHKCLSKDGISIPSSYSTAITSIERFMGLKLDVTNASLEFNFEGNNAKSLIISYTDAGNTVVLTYTFN